MAPHVVVLTGAGISADSGVATFRGADGLWEGVRPEEIATPEAWASDRARVWRFYQERRAQLATVEPNAAHHALTAFTARVENAGGTCTLITQNVDDLHERAGSRAAHMHGELLRLRCECCEHTERNDTDTDPSVFVPCRKCSHDALRPDVVWFGEIPKHMELIQQAIASCTHFIAIGTSGLVYPAAGMIAAARHLAAQTFVQALEQPANLDALDHFFQGRAADVVPDMLAKVL